MPPLTLQGDTLGEKHHHFNKLVEDALANKHYELSNINNEDSDIDNLLKIDIASKNRNVEYIIEVMKSKDMLYAATAIKKSTWLVTDPQYAHIVNPEYLHTQLLPKMNTKSFNKLMLHIRLHLKDESRVESFYEYLKETDGAHKWLQNCSIPFIERVIKNERHIPLSLFKRLCRRSAHLLTYYKKVESYDLHVKREILFLLKSHTEDVLNVIENKQCDGYVNIGKKKTEIIMKICPQRIFDNFDIYVNIIDLSVVAKYLNKKEIKTFLCKHVKILKPFLYDYNTWNHFIKNMPKEERFEFANKTFIDKTEMALFFTEEERMILESLIKPYQWYEYAPFDVALFELKKLIRKENTPSVRCAMLSVLITCARHNPQNINTLLRFVQEKHINEPFKFKIQFVNNLLLKISTHEFDVETWNVLDQLFHSMEVFTESNNNVQMCLRSIIVYKVLHDEPVPEIVEQKVTFNSFKKNQRTLNKEQNGKMFTYLLNYIQTKIQTKNIANESDMIETTAQLENALTLLRDWKKEIDHYPFILEKIQDLIEIKKKNMWDTFLSGLYFIKKSWRRHMFAESLSLLLSEETCLNALKHGPQLLTRHDKEIETLRTNDNVSLRRVLSKLRVFWPHSLAQHWTDAYLENLNKPNGQKAIIKGLFTLLHQNQIVHMAKKHIPNDVKICWGETDQTEINLRKNIAKHLHLARPLIPLDTVLWYAKGDYLQHAVPSLNAILPNLSNVESCDHLPKLLNAPVSLQKFGLHLAFLKLKSDDLKSIFLEVWNTTKNLTIRSVIFKHTYAQICKVKNEKVEKELWELLSIFIDKLDSDESTELYKKLGEARNVPISIRAEYFMKSYEFLTSLPDSANCQKYVKYLIQYAPKIIETLDSDFVADKMLSPADKFCMYESEFTDIFACYILCGKSEEDQLQRFKRVISPAMEEAFQLWDSIQSESFYIKNNFNSFLSSLVKHFRLYVALDKIPIPVKLFVEIKTKMEKELPLPENYVLHTSWKLLTEYVKLIDEHVSMFSEFKTSKDKELGYENERMSGELNEIWKDIHFKISPLLGPIIVKCLKEDTDKYSPSIHCLFADAFEKMFYEFLSFQCYYWLFILETLNHMLNDPDFIPSYLVVSKAIPKYCNNDDEVKRMRLELRKKLKSHPSPIVRMHYYNNFGKYPEDEIAHRV